MAVVCSGWRWMMGMCGWPFWGVDERFVFVVSCALFVLGGVRVVSARAADGLIAG